MSDIEYSFSVSVGEDGAEVECAAYAHGSWLVGKDGTVWDVQSPSGRIERTFDGRTALDDAVGYCVGRMLREMRSGSVYG